MTHQTALDWLMDQLDGYFKTFGPAFMTHISAVDRLKKELESYSDSQFMIIDWHTLNGMFDQSKEMEKNQISQAYRSGVEDDVIWNPLRTGEMYYNDTFR